MRRTVKAKSLQDRRTVTLARGLVGKVLARRHADGAVTRHRITEVEAYDGERDLACHASKGRTKRTEVMYRPGGIWYVYLCYGMHEMLNLVTGPADYPAAVLIRGVEDISGPGRLTKRLSIGRQLNGAAAARVSGLWLEDDGFKVPRRALRVSARIGVDYAGPVWARKPWRFWMEAGALAPKRPGR
ncbi:DNA-3-methyladenine glycosylase [Opitutus sp. GAS368]|uniref:DNA-3-methyladenine glycosylase n=1 Tax=Opitutus sp. GAS368 TaxID=1882749 RepID=UPI00087AC127|nr:DNA-3-methyladenine glycosylase [Opitutus sp. GAS368]SDS56329.1 DNA-3-methyladenine glycosylase [Opitutus sp. GAS368]